MTREDFKKRTKGYARRAIKVVESLPGDLVSQTLGRQILRAGTSVTASYRSAVRGRSRADFIARMGIVEEECDESLLWMELLVEAGRMKTSHLERLMAGGSEILAITVASIKTSRRGT